MTYLASDLNKKLQRNIYIKILTQFIIALIFLNKVN